MSGGLPHWDCTSCGRSFDAITENQLAEKRDNHLRDCNVAEDATYTLDDGKYMDLPRETEAYEVSSHFYSMFTRRENPSASRWILDTVIENGVVKHTHESDHFIFEQRIDGDLWWVIVGIEEDAFDKEDEKHAFITIYSPTSPDHERVSKYV